MHPLRLQLGRDPCPSPAACDADFWAEHEELRLLGHGHFGMVSLVRLRATGAVVAAKVVNRLAAVARCAEADPSDEASVLRRLRHPNIIRLLDVVETPATLFLLLEPQLGGDLLNRMRSLPGGVLPADEARRHARSLLGALAFIHGRGYVHRDVKPSNVLLASDGQARLADFGLAAALPRPSERCLTAVCGTQEFLAPEMVLCGHGESAGYGREVDLWGTGLLIFGCLYGFNPFQRATEIETLSAIIGADYALPQVEPRRAAECAAASALVANLLVADPLVRWDCARCLAGDAWLAAEAEGATDNGEAREAPLAVKALRRWHEPVAEVQRRLATAFGQWR